MTEQIIDAYEDTRDTYSESEENTRVTNRQTLPSRIAGLMLLRCQERGRLRLGKRSLRVSRANTLLQAALL